MRYELIYPSKYIAGADLVEKGGKDVTLVIQRLFIDDLKCQGDKTERRAVIEFERAKKKFVVNKTNLSTIADLYGPETDDWKGKPITLFTMRVTAFGKVWDAIRIRPERPEPRARNNGGARAPGEGG
ncbi:MAG: hypothetical protein V3W41_22215 [Planctomycetota bacterium]